MYTYPMKYQVLPKLKSGDRVGVISPSEGLPDLFPWVQDLGLARLRDNFGLDYIEYPTTRMIGSSLKERARDIMAAFADPENKAVIASIGGFDQIQLIKYLDPQVFIDNPKPFFGYSDNTHLHNFLWNLGIRSYYGGSIMTEFAFHQKMCRITDDSIRHAFFDEGEFEVEVSNEFNDISLDWSDKNNLSMKRQFESNEGLVWDNPSGISTSGTLWGGCLESLIVQNTCAKYLPSNQDLDGVVLYLETSEEIPDPWIVQYLLIGFGERGWLGKFNAIIVGRPKAWNFKRQYNAEQKQAYKLEQRKVITDTVRQYNRDIPIVQNVDFGHTAPQVIVPSGSLARIDNENKKLYFSY